MARVESEPAAAGGWTLRRTLEGPLPVVAGFGAPLLGVLLAILVIGPYYGIVDDGLVFGLVRSVHLHGFRAAWWSQVRTDASGGGQVRPFYWALAWAQYRAGAHHPVVVYVINWAFTGACLLVAGLGLARAFRVPRPRAPLFLGVYGAAVLVFPWTLDLFAFPSPQERWVALSAGVALLWFAEPRERVPPVAWYGVSVLVLAFGALSKATFLVYGPALLLLMLDQRRRGVTSWARLAWVLALWGAAAALLRVAGAHGSYTGEFRLSNVPGQLHSHYLWLFTLLAAVWAAYAVVRQARGRGTLLLDLIPLAVFGAFVAVYVQWQGWVFNGIGFLAAGAFALAVSRLESLRAAAVVLAAAVVWALSWTYVRTGELYGSLASIGEFARAPEALRLARAGVPVYISCEEGSQTIAGYVRREQGVALTVRPHETVSSTVAKSTPPPPDFRYALVDAHLCPARISSAEWHAIWRPGRSGGFTLYRRVGP